MYVFRNLNFLMISLLFLESLGSPSGVVANVQHCDIVVNEFELHLRYYVYFWTKYPWESYGSPYQFGSVGFFGISTVVGYLMPNPLYTYILNIYDLVWFGFMVYQPL